ncbi:MAG: NAD(P)/FAD-dependent oxidoreductase [Proteobacteria bacterium]|nr:NAD(P)/FAD-dependent oxidoreductase [Pseudomonadota bacterium]
MKYVVVGAGPAGVIAAETLRKADARGSIMLVGDEPEPPYSRMAIPYLLSGGIGEDGTYLRKSPGHYDGLRIRTLKDRVKKVSPRKGELTLASGRTLPYDRLLIATGASPVKPRVPGLHLPGVHHCWTLKDARAIGGFAERGADVVLMGAGFIGCIILESLIRRGVKLTVVEMEDRMVPRMMNDTAGAMLKRWCQGRGITVKTSTRVTKLEDAGDGGLRVHLNRGRPLTAKLVVVATGVKSNTGFLKGSGVKINGGIKVDDRLQSSVDGIYAAGDVAEGPDFSGGWSVHAIQPTAADHGRVAALNMAGREARYQGSLAMNVLDTAGLISTSFGRWQGVPGGDFAEASDPAGSLYIRLAFEGDRIIGALTLGRTDHVGVLRGLIQTRVPLGDWKAKLMADPGRFMEAYLASVGG